MSTDSSRGRVPTLLALIVLSIVHVALALFWLVSLFLLMASYTPLDQPWVYGAMAIYPLSLVVSQVYAWIRYRAGRHAAALGLALIPLSTAILFFVAMAVIWPR